MMTPPEEFPPVEERRTALIMENKVSHSTAQSRTDDLGSGIGEERVVDPSKNAWSSPRLVVFGDFRRVTLDASSEAPVDILGGSIA